MMKWRKKEDEEEGRGKKKRMKGKRKRKKKNMHITNTLTLNLICFEYLYGLLKVKIFHHFINQLFLKFINVFTH